MGKNLIETVMGAVVLVVAAMFVFFAWDMAQVETVRGYDVKAVFYRVGGLTRGSDVRISGIKVGTVSAIELDATTYDAVVTLTILPTVKLPADSNAIIASEGLLGGKYVRLEPGQDTATVAAGGSITRTQDFRALEDQVGEIIFLATGGNGERE